MAREIEVKDSNIEIFMGSQFRLGEIGTIRDLKKALERIMEELPRDETLKVSEVYMLNDELGYTLEEGINQ